MNTLNIANLNIAEKNRAKKTIARIALVCTLAGALVSPLAMADKHRQVDYARVLAAKPVYQTVERRVPVENCWTEQVREETPVYQAASYDRKPRSATGTIIGGLIGGAIGNAVGAGDENKKVGTVVGAVLGASIGHDVSRRRSGGYEVSHTEVSYRNVERCEVQERYESEQVPVGYDVTYRYHGQTYTTRTRNHPGEKMKVAVQVQPLEY